MPMTAHERATIGGHTRAALAPDRRALTEAMRRGRWQKYVDRVREVLPDASDEEVMKRAENLRRAEMTRLSALAAAKRRELRELEAELDASGLADAGSDGIDAD